MPSNIKRSIARAAALTVVSMAVYLGVAPCAPARAAAAPSERAETYTFAFHDADVSEVAEAILGKALGLSYTVDPSITAKMSFRIDQRLTGAQLLEAFEAALESSDVVMVREGAGLSLKPRAKAKGAAGLRTMSEGTHGAGYETLAASLEYAAPSEVAKALQAISADDPVVYVNDKQGLLILGGSASELDAALKVVKMLDHSGLEDAKIRFFELQEAPAQTVVEDLDKILETSRTAGVSVVPLKRLNGLFVFAHTPQAIEEVGRWIAKLDVPSRDKSESLYIYHPRNLSAASLGASLGGGSSAGSGTSGQALQSGFQVSGSSLGGMGQTSAIAGSIQSASSAAPVVTAAAGAPIPTTAGAYGGAGGQAMGFLSAEGEPVRVAVDRDSNTILFSCTASRWVKIQRILDELDRPPEQVLIEASILEVTLTDQFNFGVDWSLMTDGGQLGVNAITNVAGAVAAKYPGLSVTYLNKNNISAAVNTLSGKTAVEVVSSPKVVALDNHTAHLEVGDQVPVITQSSQNTTSAGAPVISNVDYRSTGVILDVTPRISGDDKIFLDVAQEVSSVTDNNTSNIDSPTIQQRRITTSLELSNGGLVALGGLISSNKTKSDTGIPYLKDIPGIGGIFKTATRSGDRTELIVLLTAKIVRDKGESDRVMSQLLADMKEIRQRGLLTP